MAILRRAKIGGATLTLAGLLVAFGAEPRSSEQKPNYVLKENVHLVIVPVTVKDAHGALVEDLTQDDFHIFEDGRERPVRYFSNESSPLSVVILLDTGMSAHSLDAVRDAAGSLGSSFGPNDEESLVMFDNTIRVVQDFTPRADLLVDRALKTIPEGAGPSMLGGPLSGSTRINGVPIDRPGTMTIATRPPGKRLVDALYAAAHRLKTRPAERRRIVVIISDGVNGSDNLFSLQDAVDALAASDASAYAVSFGSGWAAKRADLLARVSRESGGDIMYVQRRKGFANALPRLTDEARNAYVLGFPPASSDGKFHDIEVRATRPGVRLIARNRFLSPAAK